MRVIPPILAALTALAALLARQPRTHIWKTGARSAPLCPSGWVTKPAETAGIRHCGATGAAIGGGVSVFRTGDLVALGRRRDGVGV
jgi:hypothetical protein